MTEPLLSPCLPSLQFPVTIAKIAIWHTLPGSDYTGVRTAGGGAGKAAGEEAAKDGAGEGAKVRGGAPRRGGGGVVCGQRLPIPTRTLHTSLCLHTSSPHPYPSWSNRRMCMAVSLGTCAQQRGVWATRMLRAAALPVI